MPPYWNSWDIPWQSFPERTRISKLRRKKISFSRKLSYKDNAHDSAYWLWLRRPRFCPEASTRAWRRQYSLCLSGHSDADTVIHAVVDALLGAAALGDIGEHFPSSDPRWKDQPSTVFLNYTYNLLCQDHWKIGNIDATIVAERPKLAPYVQAMRTHLSEHLHLELSQVSIKATTTDGLGFTGRREGIACYAVALLEK